MMESAQVSLYTIDDQLRATPYTSYKILDTENIEPIEELLFRYNTEADIRVIQETGRVAIHYTGPDPRQLFLYPNRYIESYDNKGVVLINER